MNQPHDPWTCAICRRVHPVPSLARLCETRHQDQPEGEQ